MYLSRDYHKSGFVQADSEGDECTRFTGMFAKSTPGMKVEWQGGAEREAELQ